MFSKFLKNIRKDRGSSNIEYGLLGSLLVVTLIVSVAGLGVSQKNSFCVLAYNLGKVFGHISYVGCNDYSGYASGASYSIFSNQGASCVGSDRPSSCNFVDTQFLYQMNKYLGVTAVYGLADSTKTPVTTYDDAMDAINSTSGRYYGVYDKQLNQNFQYEVQTKNGDQFGIYYNGSGYGAKNLLSGDTYAIDFNNGAFKDVGFSTLSGSSVENSTK